ncbi:MAG: hypothetical protein FJ123_00780 [Deltaproteobacteria bacterium]|nr:hypothetical protein [Deltaproteobacteria bacterium]
MAEKIKCDACGKENDKGSNFCGGCGAKLAGGRITCPHCLASIDSGSKFCPMCGKQTKVEKSEQPDVGIIEGMRWKRGSDDFARRIDLDRTESPFQVGVIVEEGTRALLLKNGALTATLEPGRYDLKTFTEALKESAIKGGGAVVRGVTGWFSERAAASVDKAIDALVFNPCTVLLIDSGDVELKMDISTVYTKDPLALDISCNTVLRLDRAELFFVNVMKSLTEFSISGLKGALYDEMHNAFGEAISQKSATELHSNLSLKQEFENTVREHLNRTLGQSYGLRFFQLRTIHYRNNRYDKIKGVYQETFLLVSEQEAELAGRKRLFDVYDQKQLQDIFEQTKEVQYREQRQKVWADMRTLVNSDKMNEIKSADDLEAYLHEINKGKYLREDEVLELVNTFKQSGMKREFLLEKIGMEHDLERKRHEIERDRIGRVGEEETKLAVLEVEAKQKRRDFEERLSRTRIGKDIKDVERDIWLADEKAKATAKDFEREGDQKDIDMGIAALERMKKIKAQEKREEMNIETERLERLSKLGIEALITASGEEQAKILVDLKKTEMLKGMSDEQILAMGAKDSPELAKAFQEKFKGLSAAKQEELYKEMMKQKDTSMKVMQDMFNKALETQRDATVGVAQGGKVVYPPYGMGPGTSGGGTGGPGFYNVSMDSGGGKEKVIICSKCKTEVPPGQKYCSNCGNEMF